MKHFKSLDEAATQIETVVAVGVFDGVHLGHRELISQVSIQARETNRKSAVVTFFPYPEQVIHGLKPGHYLTMPDEKADLLGKLGVDFVVTLKFDDEMRMKRAVQFITDLKTHLNMTTLWVGPDFALGHKREGTTSFLQDIAPKYSFELRVLDHVNSGPERVSSSRIRKALSEGEVDTAASLLGRRFRLPGIVIHGDGRGRTIGVPTANLSFPADQAIPAKGVYSAWAFIDNSPTPSVVNVGVRPTVSDNHVLRVEAHLMDFDADLYDQPIVLEFVSRLRNEMKFGGLDELVAQIRVDIDAAKHVLETRGSH